MAENININVSTPNVDISGGAPSVSIATTQVSVDAAAATTNVEVSVGGLVVVETFAEEPIVEIELTSPQVTVTTLNQPPNGVQQIIPGINTTVSPATGIGIVAVNATGSVSNVSVAAPLSTALVFNLPNNTPQLTIQNATNVLTQFLRADGTWSVPPGSTSLGTVTSVTAGVGLGAPATGNSITSSGTINLLPAVGSTTIGGVKAGANVTIAADGTISSSGGSGGGGGTSWTAPANISVGDIVWASSSLPTIPGATQIFDGGAGAGGIIWTDRVFPATPAFNDGVFGNGLYVVIGFNSAIALTSPDGITWTQRSLPVSAGWTAITFGNGTFVVIATASTIALSSTDAITWTQRTLPISLNWNSVAFGNNTFVALGTTNFGVSTTSASSPDGITWTARTLPVSASWSVLTFGNNTFVAIAFNNSIALTSPDGITWTQRSLSASGGWLGAAFGNNTFVAFDLTGVAVTSPNGINWTTQSYAVTSINSGGVAFGNGYFVIVASFSSVNATESAEAYTSADGITWTPRRLPFIGRWASSFFGNNVFIGLAGALRYGRSPAQNLLFVYPNETLAGPLTCPIGSYRLLGASQDTGLADGLWVRTL